MIEVVVHSARTARSVGSWATNRIPSRMSASRCVSSSRSARSGRRTNRIVTADTRNVRASIAIVAPGPIVAASRPAIAGPMIQPTLNTASKIALARATCDRPTSPGTDAV